MVLTKQRNFRALPHLSARRYSYWAAKDAGPVTGQMFGDELVSVENSRSFVKTAAGGPYLNLLTANAAPNEQTGINTDTFYRRNMTANAVFRGEPVGGNCRFWAGFTNGSLASMLASDAPALRIAAFRWSFGVDTNIQAVTRDTGTQVLTDTGVGTPVGVSNLYEINLNDNDITFKINGAVVATNTTELLNSGIQLRFIAGLETSVQSTLAFRAYHLGIDMNS